VPRVGYLTELDALLKLKSTAAMQGHGSRLR
jgi:hypothetical protein